MIPYVVRNGENFDFEEYESPRLLNVYDEDDAFTFGFESSFGGKDYSRAGAYIVAMNLLDPTHLANQTAVFPPNLPFYGIKCFF